jgi:hypothetical protein
MGMFDSFLSDVLQVTQQINDIKEEFATSISAAIDPAGELRNTVEQIHTDVKDKVSGVTSFDLKSVLPTDVTNFKK